jgi:hypothetical protein
VKNRFQSLPFKCNLQRYIAALAEPGKTTIYVVFEDRGGAVYKLNPVDPAIESAWFQPLSL